MAPAMSSLLRRNPFTGVGARMLGGNASRMQCRQFSVDEKIAKAATMMPISKICQDRLLLNPETEIEQYGNWKAKISSETLSKKLSSNGKKGKLILVTAITPTKAGEGKTTTSIGLSDGLNRIFTNKLSIPCLREPSLGPVFGMKGGAAGGGFAQVVPMDDINLHFTGDFHAITSAHMLLSAMVDNHIHWRKEPALDVRKVDMNDRALRKITAALGGVGNGYPREDGFDITVASEVMAVLCLANDLADLERRLGNIQVGQARPPNKTFVTARDIKASGAMTALLKDAFKPNIVQTLENNPAIIHGGPFANIAHGCNSVAATKLSLAMSDFCVTEAGFGADLGAEKFMDIKCPKAGLEPDVVVLVATIRALKLHGGVKFEELQGNNPKAVEAGLDNLRRHLENISKFGVPAVVCINQFPTDTEEEISLLKDAMAKEGHKVVLSNHWAHGGKGAEQLAETVAETLETQTANFKPLYEPSLSVTDKIRKVAKEIYRADDVNFTEAAKTQLKGIKNDFPICIAKTQYSFSDNPALLNAPTGHTFTVREVQVKHGAEFNVVLSDAIMTMPGLPKVPAAEHITVEPTKGEISGLF